MTQSLLESNSSSFFMFVRFKIQLYCLGDIFVPQEAVILLFTGPFSSFIGRVITIVNKINQTALTQPH